MKKTKKQKSKKLVSTHIAVVLDKSGSMSTCLNDTIGGFNQFLKTQKELKGKATITLAQFNDNYELISDMKSLDESEELTINNYIPSGFTALLDAIGKTINDVEAKIKDMPKKSRPEKVIFVIITDGEENRSREFKKDQIMQMINSHRDEKKWEFVFIGANQDAIQSGDQIGIVAGSSLNYTQDPQGTRTMYSCLTSSMSAYRSRDVNDKSDFFEPQKDTPKK